MLSNNDYPLRDILYSVWGSTARSSASASMLELPKYYHLREIYGLGVYEWDYTPLTYMIDDHRRLRPMPTAEAPIDVESWAEALPPWRFWRWPTPRYMGYGYGWLEEYGFSSEVEIWRTGSLLDFFLFLSSLLLFFGSRHPTNGVGTGFFHLWSQSSGGGVSTCAESAERLPLSCTKRLWNLWVCTIAYLGWLIHSLFPFPFLVYWLWQPRRSGPKERENITAARDQGPGNSHSISSARHKP